MEEGKKILVVDDEAFIRVLLTQTLEDLEDRGVELLSAADGKEALEIALAERPNIIFLDVMMPYLSGYEVCRKVKEEAPEVYIILLTAKGQAVDKELGAAAGADEYVTKPFDPDNILARVGQLLGIEVAL